MYSKVDKVIVAYKEALSLRIVLISLVSFLLWYIFSLDTYDNLFASFVFIAWFDYLTINVLTERNFYPADLFVDDWFPDKNSIGNIALYTIVYFFFVVLIFYGFYYLIAENN